MSVVMVPLTDRMDEPSILPIKVCVTIDTMLNFDDDFDRHGDGDGDGDVTCKQTLTREMLRIVPLNLLFLSIMLRFD